VQLVPTIAPGHPFEKGQKVGARMPVAALADDLAAGNFQRRIQTGQPVATVVVGLPRRQAGAQGQQRLGPTQRLDLRLLVQTQHHRVGRRMQIQPDHIVNLGFRVGIGREFERRDSMWLQRMSLPDSMHGGVRDPRGPGQVAGGPMRQPRARRLQRQRHNLRALAGRDCRRPPRFGPLPQAGHAAFGESAPNPAHLHNGVANSLGDSPCDSPCVISNTARTRRLSPAGVDDAR
jgi:hypothetical protein